MIQKKLSRKNISEWSKKACKKASLKIIQKKLSQKKISEWTKRSFQRRDSHNDPDEAFKEENLTIIQKKLSRKKIFAWSKRKSRNDPKDAYKQEKLKVINKDGTNDPAESLKKDDPNAKEEEPSDDVYDGAILIFK